MQTQKELPGPCSGIMRDDTLTPDERLQLIEALFVHDSGGQWRERRADVSHAPGPRDGLLGPAPHAPAMRQRRSVVTLRRR